MEDTVTGAFNVVDDLWFCTTKEQVEDLFSKNGITKLKDRITILLRVMGVIESFNLPSNVEVTEAQDYEDELSVFLEGSWRLLAL